MVLTDAARGRGGRCSGDVGRGGEVVPCGGRSGACIDDLRLDESDPCELELNIEVSAFAASTSCVVVSREW